MTESSLSNPASTADRLSGVTFVDMLGNRLPERGGSHRHARVRNNDGNQDFKTVMVL